jgi:hypothetical protein
MTHWLFLAMLLPIAACGSSHPLTHTRASDPVWSINPERWAGTINNLTQAPALTAGRMPQER